MPAVVILGAVNVFWLSPFTRSFAPPTAAQPSTFFFFLLFSPTHTGQHCALGQRITYRERDEATNQEQPRPVRLGER